MNECAGLSLILLGLSPSISLHESQEFMLLPVRTCKLSWSSVDRSDTVEAGCVSHCILTVIGRTVQRLYRCVIPLLKTPSKHKFKTIVLSECLEFFYCFTEHFHGSLVHMLWYYSVYTTILLEDKSILIVSCEACFECRQWRRKLSLSLLWRLGTNITAHVYPDSICHKAMTAVWPF
jgi:hypothetical protein